MDDNLYSVIQTADGGYLLGGTSNSDLSGDKSEASQGESDYWVLKLDESGNIQWQNTIGGSSLDELYAVIQTTDGGYLLEGSSSSGISGDKSEANQNSDYWVVKLNGSGNIMWQNTIGGNLDDNSYSVIQTMDGGYLLGGSSNSDISGDKTELSKGGQDYWVVKLDESGNILWQKTIGGDNEDYLESVIQTSDGGYLLGGVSDSDISGDKTESSEQYSQDYWVVKLDESGNIMWQNTIGGNHEDYLQSVIQTSDGDYLLGGYSISDISGDKTEASQGVEDYWVVKLDTSGNIIWDNTIGGNDVDYIYSIIESTDSNYLIAGYSGSDVTGDKTEPCKGDNDYWMVKLDKSGSILWQKTIGGNDIEEPRSVIQTADGGYLIGGWSSSGISGDKTEENQGLQETRDYWVVKLYADSNQFTSSQPIASSDFELYPNPIQSEITIHTTVSGSEPIIRVCDLQGKKCNLTSTVLGQKITINTSNLPDAFYTVRVTNRQNGISQVRKFVKQQ